MMSSLLKTNASGHHKLPSEFSPLQRVLLTANGNMQRIISAFYNAEVTVLVEYCNLVSESEASAVYDRRVVIRCLDQPFCVATTTLEVSDLHCRQLLSTGACGIGQLFTHLHIQPTFELLDCKLNEDGTWYRLYTLTAESKFTCRIREEFVKDVFNLQAHSNLPN